MQFELLLLCEELYGDQQFNGGKQFNKLIMLWVVWYEEQWVLYDDQLDDDCDFFELEMDEKNLYFKKLVWCYNWKLMLVGVVILVVVVGGVFFMWNYG